MPVYDETFDYWQASELPPLGVGYESKGFDYDWQAGEFAPGFSFDPAAASTSAPFTGFILG